MHWSLSERLGLSDNARPLTRRSRRTARPWTSAKKRWCRFRRIQSAEQKPCSGGSQPTRAVPCQHRNPQCRARGAGAGGSGARDVAATGDQIAQLGIQLRDLTFQAEQRSRTQNSRWPMRGGNCWTASRPTVWVLRYARQPQAAWTSSNFAPEASLAVASPCSPLRRRRKACFHFFAPLRDGEKIQPGRALRISPNWTVREEEGTMLGTVAEARTFQLHPRGCDRFCTTRTWCAISLMRDRCLSYVFSCNPTLRPKADMHGRHRREQRSTSIREASATEMCW